jgi:hypothetical protein
MLSQSNLARLVVGNTYLLRYKADRMLIMREAVMGYLGRHGNETDWDLRPVAGTQIIPESWIISVTRVPKTTKRYIDIKVKS